MVIRFYKEKDYLLALRDAILLARRLNRETGLEKFKEYNTPGYLLHTLPKPENRYGFELRLQVVRPDEPLPNVEQTS